jgi:hypothetical protein
MEGIMSWIGSILDFLRDGQGSKQLDLELLVRDANESGEVDASKVVQEMRSLHRWVTARKAIREKAAAAVHAERDKQQASEVGAQPDWMEAMPSFSFEGTSFGLSKANLDFEAADDDDDDESDNDELEALTLDPIEVERLNRARLQRAMDRAASLPPRPSLRETAKLLPRFQSEIIRYFA